MEAFFYEMDILALHTMKKINLAIRDYITSVQDTPCYYLDMDSVIESMRSLNEKKEENVSYLFPVKALPFSSLQKSISDFFQGFDISNPTELGLLPDNLEGKTLWSSAPYQAFSADDNRIIQDTSLEKIKSSPSRAKMALRISLNPDSRFGVPAKCLKQELVSRICGIHIHHEWSEPPFGLMEKTISELHAKLQLPSGFCFNLGGGFNAISQNDLLGWVNSLAKAYPEYHFLLEPGRATLTGHCALVGKVLETQNLPGNDQKTIVVTNISKSSHLKWEPTAFSLCKRLKDGKEQSERAQLFVGPNCFEGDFLNSQEHLEKTPCAAPGDILIFQKISGYGAAWNTSFNGIPKASLKFFLNGKIEEMTFHQGAQ